MSGVESRGEISIRPGHTGDLSEFAERMDTLGVESRAARREAAIEGIRTLIANSWQGEQSLEERLTEAEQHIAQLEAVAREEAMPRMTDVFSGEAFNG